MGTADSPIPSWITKWLYFTAAVFLFDGSYCLLRSWVIPSFKEGGCLSAIYYVYSIYIEVDKNYGNVNDSFVTVVGIGNIAEGAINIAVVLCLIENIRWRKMAAIVSCIMTAYKTAIFFLYAYDPAAGGRHIDNWFGEITMIILPNILWIAAPACAAFILIKDFVEEMSEQGKNKIKSVGVDDKINDLVNENSEEEIENDESVGVDEMDSSFRRRYNLRSKQS